MIFILGYYLDSGNGAFDRLRYAFLIPLALGTVALPCTFSRASQLAFGLGATFLLLRVCDCTCIVVGRCSIWVSRQWSYSPR
ncbi:MAG: hypothetical protein IT331_10015 [Anaerolineae bacterium]|nr:hypothetical protein [Anaerolineae bacterium]